MKLMKRIAVLLMSAILIAGILAPVQTEAASLSVAGIKFYRWNGAGNCLMVTKAQDIYEFQYQVFNNSSKLVKTAKSWNYITEDKYNACYVEGLPKLSCAFVRVRARRTTGGWSAWSPKVLIVPMLGVAGKINVAKAGDMKAKLSWSPVTGAYDYQVYLSTNGKSGWVKAATIKGTAKSRSTIISSFNGKKLVMNQKYYYKVITRRKFSGKFYSSNLNKTEITYGYFWFY